LLNNFSHGPPLIIQQLAGETLHLLAERAVYWPRKQALIVADIHFGKAAAFRAAGIPVPAGTTAANLAVLDTLLVRYAVDEIIFLGDFFHAKTAHATATLTDLHHWRTQRPLLRLVLIRGNHDRHAGDPPKTLNVQVVDAPYLVDGLAFCHHPDPLDGAYVLAGHIHPVCRLRNGADNLRLPCYVVGARHMVLPSFGAFTGGFNVTAQAGERLFVIADDTVVALPGKDSSRFARL
jgi:DNA ligase-associated metallophosphoesterase